MPRQCEYCKKVICRACVKSSKRIGKVTQMAICKSCWGDLKARKKFKSV
ncbi:Uncharacterised protein [Candidatus Burarchaeum australiense]|nr:Uncharacterised protein [Candidatus Burarchaeum australiense]